MASPQKATDEQIIEALHTHPSIRQAAKSLGIDPAAIHSRKMRLALKGFSPAHNMTRTVPDGFTVKGVSTLYNAEGAISAQWVKSNQDAERVRTLLDEAANALAAQLPRAKPAPAPKQTRSDLLSVYVVTDFHLGMLSWGEETGADWDTEIAERMLVRWFDQAIAQAPDSETAVLAQLGDFLHWDGMDAVTPQSRHLLDADTRFQRLVRVAIRALRQVIDKLLTKHTQVRLIMAEGNHDPASSIWLREMFRALYENEKRITVDLSPSPYYCVEHGKTSVFFHHGHKRNTNNIDDIFAAKFREVFGRTKHSYAHLGHLHHVKAIESALMVVEQHRTLAAPDAYAARGGWLSGRDAQVITYHKTHGEVSRVRVSAAMVQA